MKILFLDIDGVLNSRSTTDFRNNLYPVDDYMAFLVGKIQLDTRCDIVLSSSWRYHEGGITEIRKRFPIIDITPKTSQTRGQQIQVWLDKHPGVKRYAILDDDSDMLESQMPNFFKTTFQYGLTEDIARKVTEHLNAS